MQHARACAIALSTLALTLAVSGCSSRNSFSRASTSASDATGTPPEVTGIGQQANGVAVNRWQYVQFNEALDAATVNNKSFVIKDSNGIAANGNVRYFPEFNIIGFQPSPALQESTSYAASVTTGIANPQGVHLASPYEYTFTTRSYPDTSRIYVKSAGGQVSTCNNAVSPIEVHFNEGADITTLNSGSIFLTSPDGKVFTTKMQYDVVKATVSLTPPLLWSNGSYKLTVQNVADAAGEAMKSPYYFTFSEGCSTGT